MFFFFLLIISIAVYWGYLEIGEAKFAKNWSETKVENTNKVIFPKDEGHHSNSMEWWYYNGHLIAKSGKEYSFHFTTFIVNGVMTHTVFHGSLTDHQQNKHYTDQFRIGGNPSRGITDRFYFKQNNWFMAGSDGHDRIKIKSSQFEFDLQLKSTQAPIFHGDNGIITLNKKETSYYYSRARMNITGFLKVNNKLESVSGVSWFDHQWGDFSTINLSWDWFSLQLNDAIDLMIYQIRDNQGNPVRYEGSYTKQGETEILKSTDFVISPKTQWTSKKTSKTYPVSWNIQVPKKNINLNVESIIENCEFDAKLTTYNVYWEGAINISGSHTGTGFIELNGVRAKKDLPTQPLH